MQPKVIEWVKVGSGAVAIITAALSLVGWTNSAFLGYLSDHFATKVDMIRIEQKLDRLLQESEHNYGRTKYTSEQTRDASRQPRP